MPTNVMTPRKETSDTTFRATTAVTGKRFLRPSGDRTGGLALSTDTENVYRMAPCGAGQKACGVSEADVLSGGKGSCKGQPGRIVVMEAGAAIVAGVEVMSDALGRAITWTSAASEANKALGQAMSGASGLAADVEIKLY